MRNFNNGIPEWPRYEQYTDGFSDHWLLRVIFVIIYMVSIVPRVQFIPTVWTVSFGIFGFIAASECVKAWVHNVRERRRWRREVGTLVTWEQVRELTRRDATEWVLLGNLKKRGYVGWGHNWRGGWDAVALQNRRTGALFAVKGKTWDVAKRKGDAWRIPTHEGGEVSESEIDELLPRLRDPKTRYEAQCRLGRVSARATTLVLALLALLDDEDEDVSRRRGWCLGHDRSFGQERRSCTLADRGRGHRMA